MTAINLRTAFAAMAAAFGANVKTIPALMEHTTPEMVQKIYAKKEGCPAQ